MASTMCTTKLGVAALAQRTVAFAVAAFVAVLLVFVAMVAMASPAWATDFTVTKTDDTSDGTCDADCSLREGIDAANAAVGADAIGFNIPGDGPHTIAPLTQLPTITGPVTLDGYTQPGASANTLATGSDAVLKIVLDGRGTTSAGIHGLAINANDSTVRGLVINDFRFGIVINSRFLTPVSGNRVEGNYIGTNAAGTAALANSSGVVIQGAASNTVAGTSNNTVGGTTSGARNVISGNTNDGISVTGTASTGNRILGNSIFANGNLGIDLGDNGVTLNDDKDPDTGANNLQNFPMIQSAKNNQPGLTGTTVRGTLNSTPNGTFTVQFFSNPADDDPADDDPAEGKTYLGEETSVTTDADGNASFVFTGDPGAANGETISTTATNTATGDTSEFSAAVVVDTTAPRVIRVKPRENATGIEPGTNVMAFFSEAMRADSINTTTFKIFKAGEDSARKATVTYDGATDKATLDPSADLRRGDSYRVVVNRGARDEAGNRLDQDEDPSNGNQKKV